MLVSSLAPLGISAAGSRLAHARRAPQFTHGDAVVSVADETPYSKGRAWAGQTSISAAVTKPLRTTLDRGSGCPVVLSTRIHAQRDLSVSPRFKLGQQVRARNLNPVGHTRLPRYARGKVGTIHRDHGVFIFPDTNAHFLGEKPQHVYSVRFAARELWGAQAPEKDCVYLDMWDDYLDPA